MGTFGILYKVHPYILIFLPLYIYIYIACGAIGNKDVISFAHPGSNLTKICFDGKVGLFFKPIWEHMQGTNIS